MIIISMANKNVVILVLYTAWPTKNIGNLEKKTHLTIETRARKHIKQSTFQTGTIRIIILPTFYDSTSQILDCQLTIES